MVITLHLKSKNPQNYGNHILFENYDIDWLFFMVIYISKVDSDLTPIRFKETQVESKHIVIIKLWGSLIHMHLPRANQQTSFNLFLFQGMVKSVKPVICGLDPMTLTFIACLSVFSSFLLFWCMWIFVLTDAVSRFRSFHK